MNGQPLPAAGAGQAWPAGAIGVSRVGAMQERAQAIVAEMSLDEKAALCSGASFWKLKANERLGLRAIMVTDGPHGLRKQVGAADAAGLRASVPATCFPTASALACTWNVSLLRDVGAAVGEECRAEDVAVLLGPGLNIKRHPLCGRNFEYFSEDPLLSGELAAAMVAGVQSQGVGACLKHYAVNNQERRRMVVNAVVDERTLREIYLTGFEIAVRKARPWTVMCAYNKVNGAYCSENERLINQILRDEWGFDGAAMTDWGAANDRVLGVAAGMDLEMPGSGGLNDRRVADAVRSGELPEAALDGACSRVVSLVLAASEPDAPPARSDQDAHHELARKAACEAAVLLQNEEHLLPLSPSGSIAIIGAFAKHPRFQGTGSSRVRPTRVDCAFDAIERLLGDGAALAYAPGYDPATSASDPALIDEAVARARQADVAVAFVGLPELYESEGFDREHMRLPAQHEALIEALCAANPATAVVLMNGAAVEMPWAAQPKAILEGWLGGQAGGAALADLLFGRANPSGKLAETFPLRQADVPSDRWFPGTGRQVQHREGMYVGYRYFDSAGAQVLFPFGHGLSYTRFDYADLSVKPIAGDEGAFEASVTVRNAGERAGAEVAQLYVHHVQSPVHRPEQELRAFSKAELAPGESCRLSFALPPRAFSWYDAAAGDWATPAGTFEVRIGASSRDVRLRTQVEVLSPRRQPAALAPAAAPLAADGVAEGALARWLGHPIPAAEPPRPFHLNSTVGELRATWLGRIGGDFLMRMFHRRMGLGAADAATRKMFSEMLQDMPLRSLALHSRGMGFHVVAALAALAEGRLREALRAWRGKTSPFASRKPR